MNNILSKKIILIVLIPILLNFLYLFAIYSVPILGQGMVDNYYYSVKITENYPYLNPNSIVSLSLLEFKLGYCPFQKLCDTPPYTAKLSDLDLSKIPEANRRYLESYKFVGVSFEQKKCYQDHNDLDKEFPDSKWYNGTDKYKYIDGAFLRDQGFPGYSSNFFRIKVRKSTDDIREDLKNICKIEDPNFQFSFNPQSKIYGKK